MDFNQFGYQQADAALESNVTRVMRRVYLKMTLGLVVTALISLLFASDASLMSMVFANRLVFWGLIIAELAVVFTLSGAINKLSPAVASLLFYGYSALNGVVLSSIFIVYAPESIAKTFFITAGVFGAMTIYGYCTTRNLARLGSFLFMALIGLIICSVVNIFVASSGLDWIISLAGVAIFIGLTAWDTQKIKQWVAYDGGVNTGKIATMGALSLYLDFVNLFLYLLRFFGSSRD